MEMDEFRSKKKIATKKKALRSKALNKQDKKEKAHFVSRKSKTPPSDVRIHRLITEREFLRRIPKDPYSAFTNFDVKYAVEMLGKWCRLGDERLKSKGARILKKARLTAYIPKTSRGYLKVYRDNPERLLSEVMLRASKLKVVLPKRAKSEWEKLEVIRKLIDPEDAGKSIDRFFPPKSLKDRTNIALGLIAYDNGVSYDTVSNLYEKLKKTSTKVGTPPYLDDYKKAYNDYVIREQLRPSIGAAHIKFTKVSKTGDVLETVNL